jgi:hypothetical protein
MKRVRNMIPLAALLAGAGPACGQAAPPPAPRAPVIQMEDQFERRHSLAEYRGDVAVLIYGDRASAEANKKLGEALHVYFHPAARGLAPAQAQRAPVRPLADQPAGARTPDVRTVAVAAVGKVPALVRGMVRAGVRGNAPDVPVWLDFENQMKGQFGMAAGVPNVAVVDTAGSVRYTFSGELSDEQFRRVASWIEGLRREGSKAAANTAGR